MSIPRILIAGQSSGVGKTTITLGIIAALSRRGLRVQPFKCGPDYIDPTYHTLASGRPCRNLDTWMLTPEQMVADFNRASVGADIAVIEGVMGLFDGSSYTEETGSSAHIAKLMSAPVLLVLDIGKLARSAGALALGYQQFDPELNLAGVILNRAGSESHANGCAEAIDAMTQLPSVGWLSKHSGLHIPERHLGLIPTDERSSLETLVDASADAVEATFDLNRIVQVAGWKGGRVEGWKGRRVEREIIPKHVTLAVARDEAFSFYYPANLELLADLGVEVKYFSPLRDKHLPENVDGLYLGGGFPEVYANYISANQSILQDIRAFHAAGKPIYAECGGFMVLTEAMTDVAGKRWPMAGLIPGETQMQQKLAALGYRVATATQDNLLVQSGEQVRGHEFHYSHWDVDASLLDSKSAWHMRRRADDSEVKPAGYIEGNLLASYLHVHMGQNPMLARRFVEQMKHG